MKNLIIVLFVCITCACVSSGKNVTVSKFSVENKDLCAEYDKSHSDDPISWALRCREMIDAEAVNIESILEFEAKAGALFKVRLMKPIYYLEEKEENVYELKSDLEEGCIVEYSCEFAQEDQTIISIKSHRYIPSTRPIFKKVPEWNVGKPSVREFKEIELNLQHFVDDQWNILDIKSQDGTLTFKAIKIQNEGKESSPVI